MRMSKK